MQDDNYILFFVEISFIELGKWDQGKDAGANYTYVVQFQHNSDCQTGIVLNNWQLIQSISGQTSVNTVTILSHSSFPMSGQYLSLKHYLCLIIIWLSPSCQLLLSIVNCPWSLLDHYKESFWCSRAFIDLKLIWRNVRQFWVSQSSSTNHSLSWSLTNWTSMFSSILMVDGIEWARVPILFVRVIHI